MYCIYCGKYVTDTQRFCSYCGEKVEHRANDEEKEEKQEPVKHVYISKSDMGEDGIDNLKEIFEEIDIEKKNKEAGKKIDREAAVADDDEMHLSFTDYVEIGILLFLFIALLFYYKQWVIDPKPVVTQKTESIYSRDYGVSSVKDKIMEELSYED